MHQDTMTMIRRTTLAALAAPLVLALAACSSSETDLPEGDAIAAIAPPEGQQWSDVASETPEGGFVVGNPDAPIKLMEYASLTCPHCKDFAAEADEALHGKYVASGVVSYELRNQIHDPIDLTMAMLVRCSGPEAFQPLAKQMWDYLPTVSQLMGSNQEAYKAALQQPEDKRYQAIAQTVGLIDFVAARGIAHDQAMQCLADPAKAREILDRSDKQSDELDVTGTPTFFVNGRNIGTHTWETLEPILQNAGAR